MKNGIFLSVKDLMLLTGTMSYESARQEHQAIRDALAPDKKKLTIGEYCSYHKIPYEEVVRTLEAYYAALSGK